MLRCWRSCCSARRPKEKPHVCVVIAKISHGTLGLRHRRLCAGYLSETRWILESDGRLRRVSLLAARSRDGLLSEPTAGARHLCDGASDFGPLYRSSDPSRGGGIGVEVVGLLSRAAFLVTSVCYNRLHHWGGRRFGQTGNLRSWSKAQEGDCAITGATTIEIAQPKELARGKMAVTADREEGVAAGAICPAGPR